MDRYLTLPLLDAFTGEHSGHVPQPVEQQAGGTGCGQGSLAVGDAFARRSQEYNVSVAFVEGFSIVTA